MIRLTFNLGHNSWRTASFFYSIVGVIVSFNVLPLLVPRLARHEHSYLQAALFFYYFCTEVSRPFFPLYSQSFHTGMTSSLQMALPQIVWGATALLFTPLGTYLGKHYGILVEVDQFFASTKTMSCCDVKLEHVIFGHFVSSSLRFPNGKLLTLSDRTLTCPSCGIVHDRDINSARNLRDIG